MNPAAGRRRDVFLHPLVAGLLLLELAALALLMWGAYTGRPFLPFFALFMVASMAAGLAVLVRARAVHGVAPKRP